MSEAPPDVGFLADAVEALEAGRPLPQFAAEELAHLLRLRGGVDLELRRREALRVMASLRAANPDASERAIATLAARRLHQERSAETLRRWFRSAPPLPHGPCSDDGGQ